MAKKKKIKRFRTNLLQLSWKNWAIMGCGILFICIGYLFLYKEFITLAPIFLVLGYCVLIPIGIMIK